MAEANTAIWRADSYAKINLGLHVLEKLPTGYHLIETGFAFIDWKDRITLQAAEEDKLEMSEEEIPTDRSNLVWKAVDILDRYVGLPSKYHISVEKKIPAGAGLGGGSSNAATVLRMVNKAEVLGLSTEDLVDLSRNLGADVPFFLYGQTGIGSGLGQDIELTDLQPDTWILTVFPGIHSSTAEAYKWAIPSGKEEEDLSLKSTLLDSPYEEWPYFLRNDLEKSVFQEHELVGNLKDQIMEFGAVYSAMSGSGSAVYGLFEQDFVAFEALKAFNELDFRANITKPKFRPDYGIYRID